MRPRNAAATKAGILEAAKQCFSQDGYTNTGIRDIAAAAGVSYGLLRCYFPTKAALFEAALRDTSRMHDIGSMERRRFGRTLAEIAAASLGKMTSLSMSILTAGDPQGQEVASRVVEESVIAPLAEYLGAPHANERATAAVMLLVGFLLHGHTVAVITPCSDRPVENPLVAWLATQLQRIVDEPESWNG